MKEVYSFWCSKCNISHPGECQPNKELNNLPAVGSKWRGYHNLNGSVWKENNWIYTVLQVIDDKVKFEARINTIYCI